MQKGGTTFRGRKMRPSFKLSFFKLFVADNRRRSLAGAGRLVKKFIVKLMKGEAQSSTNTLCALFVCQSSMKSLADNMVDIMELPRWTVPPLALSPFLFYWLRESILALGDAFDSAGGWGLERAFFKWWYRLPIGNLFPRPLELQARNATWCAVCLYICAKARVNEASAMDAVTLGILLRHELFHSFYSYEQGGYFYQFFPGLPGVSWCLKIYSLTTQDLQAFWDNNAELKAELQEEFGEA